MFQYATLLRCLYFLDFSYPCIQTPILLGTHEYVSTLTSFFRPHNTSQMMVVRTKPFTVFLAATLLMTKANSCLACPPQCQCSTYTVKCIGKDLRTIPQGLPLTARSIDLSKNPHLKIQIDYFLRFEHLFILYLSDCGQRGPIHLPNTVINIAMDGNFFTIDALRQMFTSKLQSLKTITLESNHLQASDTKALLEVLPTGLTLLNINNNNLTQLTREAMVRFKNIKTLRMNGCFIENIEAGTFDDMKNLSELKLDGNILRSLPEKLFKYNSKLSRLELNDNKLVDFNATKLGLRNVQVLELAFNRILTFDIQPLNPVLVKLNDNKIQQLDTNIFHNQIEPLVLIFSNNNIRYISRDAFQGIHGISQLLLNNNSLSSLPQSLFKGIQVNIVYLQDNPLSNLNGAFYGVKNFPTTLILTGNRGFTSLNGTDYRGLSYGSKIYLNCGKLKRITNIAELKPKITCIPKSDENIVIRYSEGFSCSGFECKNLELLIGYNCSACRQGYYSSCRDIQAGSSSCVKCPPGSYYQDEVASTGCKTCRPGQFVPPERSPGKDAADCQTCPPGTNTTIVAGTRACDCLRGYSRTYRFGPCKMCTMKGFNCSLDYQVLQNGYWMTWEGTKQEIKIHSDNQNVTQRTCEYAYKSYVRNLDTTDDTYDRRTMHFNCQMPLPIKCLKSTSCVGGLNPRCSVGYTGVLCAVCDAGYSQQFGQCIRCPKRAWAYVQCISHLALFGIFCLLVSLDKSFQVHDIKNSVGRAQTTDQRTITDIMLSSFKILIGFYQVLISIIRALSNVHWPEHLRTAIDILQYIQFQVIQMPSIHCINPALTIDAIDELWITLIIVTVIPLLAATYYFTKSLYIYYTLSLQSDVNRKRHLCGRNCIIFVALFLFVTYTLISTKMIEILPISCHSFCTAKRHGKCVHSMSFLRSDYSISCPTMADHKATLTTAYSSLIIPLGLPLLLLILLKMYAPGHETSTKCQHIYVIDENSHEEEDCSQYDLQYLSMNNDPLYDEPNTPIMTSALKFTYENYHSHYWYWEVVETIRKLLMTICIVLFIGHIETGLACTIIVAMLFTILHAIYKPFKSKFESGAQFLSLILIPLNLAFGAVLQSQYVQNPSVINNEVDSFSLGIALMAFNSSIVIAIVARLVVIIVKKAISRVLNSNRN